MSELLPILGKTWWLILRTKGLKPIAIEPRMFVPRYKPTIKMKSKEESLEGLLKSYAERYKLLDTNYRAGLSSLDTPLQ